MRRLIVSCVAILVFMAGSPEGRAQDRTIGQKIDDAAILTAVKAKLVGDRPANMSSVNVDVQDAVVTLRGSVPTAEDKVAAERLARGTDGVKAVSNQIVISGSGTAEADSPSASPPSGFAGRHTMTGEVTSIDTASGRVQLRTREGDMDLVLPPSAVRDVRRGDRITVEVGVRR